MIDRVQTTITTVGANGSAAGKAVLKTPGGPAKLLGLGIDYVGQPAGSTDITVKDANGPAGTVYSKSNSNTDVYVRPALPQHKADGTAIESPALAPVVDNLLVEVAQGDSGKTVIVTAYFEN